MKTPIKLGQKSSSPCCPVESGEHFPSAYLSGDEFKDMPKEGTMIVRFKRNSKNTSEREGKTHVDVSVDLVEIVSVTGETEAEEEENTGDVLDRLRKELLEKDDE